MNRIANSLIKKSAIALGALALGACSFNMEINGSQNWKIEGDTKEGCLTVIDNFFKGTIAKKNTVVTVSQGTNSMTLNILGDKAVLDVAGEKSYAYVQDGKYYVATAAGEGGSVIESKTQYDSIYSRYMMSIDAIRNIKEEEGMTFYAKDEGFGTFSNNSSKNRSESTLEVKGAAKGQGEFNIAASAKNSLVETMKVTIKFEEDTPDYVVDYAFAYGSAKVELSDTSNWAK